MKKILTRLKTPPEFDRSRKIARFPIHIILENIRSLYNVGSIFRSADAARIDCIHLTGITGYPPRKEIAKTALGAQQTVPWDYHEKSTMVIPQLKRRGFKIIAIEQTDLSKNIWTRPLDFPVCFVFGYEIEGIDQSTLDCCDDAIEIPMYGFKGSLNVAVTCGIVLFESIRQLQFMEGNNASK